VEHQEVVETVKNWLKRQHPSPRRVAEGSHADILLMTDYYEKPLVTYHLQVECKGTEDNVDVAIGQCLRYYALSSLEGLFTYLAIPEDFKQLVTLQAVLRLVTLPIGLLSVYNDGKVEIIKKAEGSEITLEIGSK